VGGEGGGEVSSATYCRQLVGSTEGMGFEPTIEVDPL
jgi:hypothetical protein